jgi:hypothetical protein
MDLAEEMLEMLKADIYLLRHHSETIKKCSPDTRRKMLKRFSESGKFFYELAVECIKNGERNTFYESIFWAFGDGRVDFTCLPLDFVADALRPSGEFVNSTWSDEHGD